MTTTPKPSGAADHNTLLTPTTWLGYDETGEVIGFAQGYADDPAGAAQFIHGRQWAGGKHRITVANSLEVKSFDIELSVEEVSVGG